MKDSERNKLRLTIAMSIYTCVIIILGSTVSELVYKHESSGSRFYFKAFIEEALRRSKDLRIDPSLTDIVYCDFVGLDAAEFLEAINIIKTSSKNGIYLVDIKSFDHQQLSNEINILKNLNSDAKLKDIFILVLKNKSEYNIEFSDSFGVGVNFALKIQDLDENYLEKISISIP